MDASLTRDGKHAIALLYKEFERRKEEGLRKPQAIFFDIQDEANAEIFNAIEDSVPELINAKMISRDIVGDIKLEDAAIIFMEKKTTDTIKQWLSFGAQFIP